MTTIAYRSGIIAADSRETWESEAGGASYQRCEKLFRKKIGRRDVVIGTAGGSYLGMVFVDWYPGIAKVAPGSGQPPEILRDAHLEEDFECVILEGEHVYTVNHLCRPVRCIEPFVAVGSGRKAAMAAMHMGANAKRAVEIACKIDPYSALPIVTMRLRHPLGSR